MVHKRLNYFIENQGITKKELAKKTDVAYNNVVSILTGQVTLGMNVFKKIKHSYPNLNTEWVFFGNGNMDLTNESLIISNETMSILNRVEPNNYEELNALLSSAVIDKEKIIKNLEKENANLTKRLEALENNEVIHIKSNMDREVEIS